MLPNFPASEFFSEGNLTPWDSAKPPSRFPPPPVTYKPPQEPVTSKPASATTKNLSPGSNNKIKRTTRLAGVIDERKLRRMVSNRESAKRSRMRKQKDLENLTEKANQFRTRRHELSNWLRLISYQDQILRQENDWLRSEVVILRQRLWNIRQVLLVRQLQQNLNPLHSPMAMQ